MSDDVKSYASWKSLPALGGGVWVAMVTEVLDGEGIPNLVKTDLASGGLGVVTGTDTLGKAWRIQVPEDFYIRSLEIYESILGGNSGEPVEETDDPAL
ncbi:MAG: hypothetical protein KDB65_01885 [Calditrichaeota bacterium]|nr:hypothetical protein [Calditrichota bacterium]